MEAIQAERGELEMMEVELVTEQPEGVPSEIASHLVNVIWGPVLKELALQGMTVGEAYRVLQVPLNIPPGVRPLVNGARSGARKRLAAGDVLEFLRTAGEKG